MAGHRKNDELAYNTESTSTALPVNVTRVTGALLGPQQHGKETNTFKRERTREPKQDI